MIEITFPHIRSSVTSVRPNLSTSHTSMRSGLAAMSDEDSGEVNDSSRNVSMTGVGVRASGLADY